MSDFLQTLTRETPVPDAPGQIETTSIFGPHGVTAEVPTFAEVLAWQEKRRSLCRGYYRLVYPPLLQGVKRQLEARFPGRTVVFFCSVALAAKEWAEFLLVETPVRSVDVQGIELALPGMRLDADSPHRVRVLSTPGPELPDAEMVLWDLSVPGVPQGAVGFVRDAGLAARFYERNRRRGGTLSARDLEVCLGRARAEEGGDAVLGEVAADLGQWESADRTFLCCSGMQAVTMVLDLMTSPGRPLVAVVGHVYRDTHILLAEMPWAGKDVRGWFVGCHDLEELREVLARPECAGVFFETITNPLGEVPDLPRIVALAHNAGLPVVVDNTMATPYNTRPLTMGADVVLHSTTKYFSGSNTHGGGVVMVRDPVWADRLADYQVRWGNGMSPQEAAALFPGLATFAERMPRFNANGRAVAAFLAAHPAVERVYAPYVGAAPHLRDASGVVSFTVKGGGVREMGRFFDHPMPGIRKAPSLGSDTTLFCPYILLTYFDKSEAELSAYGLPRYLYRVAVGSEADLTQVLQSLDAALRAASGRSGP